MIDREQVISWARGADTRYEYGVWSATTEELEALITRAMNEAYERAAQLAEDGDDLLMGDWHAERLRALKTERTS